MSSDVLKVERRDGAALLTIDRPHAGNSISADVTAALDTAVGALERDGDLVAIVITGEGDKFFSSGGDIKQYRELVTREQLQSAFARPRRLLVDLRTLARSPGALALAGLLVIVSVAAVVLFPRQAIVSVAGAAEQLQARIEELLEVEADPSMTERLKQAAQLLGGTEIEVFTSLTGQPGRRAARLLGPLKRELKALDRGSSRRVWYAIRDFADQAQLSRELATLHLEVPVDYRPRIGRSKVSGTVSGTVKAGTKILALIARYALTPRNAR